MSNVRVGAAAEGMPASSRRSFLATTSVAVVASLPGCSLMSPAAASILNAAPYMPAEPGKASVSDDILMRLGQAFDQALARHDARRARITAGELAPHVLELSQTICEARADRVMHVQPVTLTGLALWARVMLWRFDPSIRGLTATPSQDLAQHGVNEAYALAASIGALAQAVQS
jgi:hypothetical protein